MLSSVPTYSSHLRARGSPTDDPVIPPFHPEEAARAHHRELRRAIELRHCRRHAKVEAGHGEVLDSTARRRLGYYAP